MARKVADYLKSGVQMIWIIHPEEGTVVVHRPHTTLETYDCSGGLDGGTVLPGFRCAVADLFSSPGDEPSDSLP